MYFEKMKPGDLFTIERRKYMQPYIKTDKEGEAVCLNDGTVKAIAPKIPVKPLAEVKLERGVTNVEKKPILDSTEQRYLEGVLRPFIKKHVTVSKIRRGDGKEFLHIRVENDEFNLPLFEGGAMYAGMTPGKGYTVAELGLYGLKLVAREKPQLKTTEEVAEILLGGIPEAKKLQGKPNKTPDEVINRLMSAIYGTNNPQPAKKLTGTEARDGLVNLKLKVFLGQTYALGEKDATISDIYFKKVGKMYCFSFFCKNAKYGRSFYMPNISEKDNGPIVINKIFIELLTASLREEANKNEDEANFLMGLATDVSKTSGNKTPEERLYAVVKGMQEAEENIKKKPR